MGIFGAAIKGFGMLGKKTTVKNTNPPMIKIKPKPKGTTPKNLDNQKKIKVSDKPAILGKETYNYEGLKKVKGSQSMKEKSKPIKLPPRKGPPSKKVSLSSIKESNPALYKKYMENLGKKTPTGRRFKKSFDNVMGDNKGLIKKSVTLPVVISGTNATLKNKKKEKKK